MSKYMLSPSYTASFGLSFSYSTTDFILTQEQHALELTYSELSLENKITH